MRTVRLTELPSDTVFGSIFGVNQYWKAGSSWSFFENPRKNHGFMHVLCTRVDIAYPDGRMVSFPQGSFLYIPKFCRYRIDFINTGELYENGLPGDRIVNFDIRRFSGEAFALAEEIVCLESPASEKVSALFEKIVGICRDMRSPLLYAARPFYELLAVLAEKSAPPGSPTGSVRESAISPAIRYLDTHVSANVSIPYLAHMCLLSTSAFRAAFKSATGMSPVQYRMHTKILKAQQLLCSTDEPTVKEIAEELGFCDSTYFCRVFYKTTGLTATEYRRKKE